MTAVLPTKPHLQQPRLKIAAHLKTPTATPDLSHFRTRYPLTVANFGPLANREAWLRRIWELEARWPETMSVPEEVIVRGAPPAGLAVEGKFDIIYAGGALGLLDAAVMSGRYHRSVLVFDEQTVGRTSREWNISAEELREFERTGLFTKDEIESAVANRYRGSIVKFHDAGSCVKAERLWMHGVLDVAIEANKLLELAAAKIRAQAAPGCALINDLRVVRVYVEPHRVCVETQHVRSGARQLFAGRLFVDATGTNSLVSRQINEGRALTHVCPTVGTVARGFMRSRDAEPDKVDFNVGEILVSTEDASHHRQFIWKGFAGNPRRDEYTTYLFFYDAVDSPAEKSLLALFEHYFESLPAYKRAGAQWRVQKPIFNYIPSFHQHGWRRGSSQRTAQDRVMLIGETVGILSPLTFCGFGPHLRHLGRLTHLTSLALDADLLDAASLSEINAAGSNVAQMSSLAEFLRPSAKSQPAAVNETLNAAMAALHNLDERVRRELFQDRLTFGALKSLLNQTARLYPRIFQRVREHLGARGTFWWLANIAEAFLSERRERATALDASWGAQEDEGAAEKFARYVAIYKKARGAGLPD